MLIKVISIPVKNESRSLEILLESHLPISTPAILEHNKANELPIKTIRGLPDSAESISVAN